MIWEGLRIDMLLIHVKKSQLRCLRCFLGDVFQACPSTRRPWGKPGTLWKDSISQLSDELKEVAGEREGRASLQPESRELEKKDR